MRQKLRVKQQFTLLPISILACFQTHTQRIQCVRRTPKPQQQHKTRKKLATTKYGLTVNHKMGLLLKAV